MSRISTYFYYYVNIFSLSLSQTDHIKQLQLYYIQIVILLINIEFKELVSVNGNDGFIDTKRMRAFDCRTKLGIHNIHDVTSSHYHNLTTICYRARIVCCNYYNGMNVYDMQLIKYILKKMLYNFNVRLRGSYLIKVLSNFVIQDPKFETY